MLKFALALAILAWSERAYLRPKLDRWRPFLPAEDGKPFDPAPVKAAIDTYEPVALQAAQWFKKEQSFLLPIIARWRSLYRGGKPSFDGPAVKAAIQKWEPIAFEAAQRHKSGEGLLKAAYLAYMNSAGPKWNEF